jgi:hypothetical protein
MQVYDVRSVFPPYLVLRGHKVAPLQAVKAQKKQRFLIMHLALNEDNRSAWHLATLLSGEVLPVPIEVGP